jgi:hypothetical protein
MCASALPLIALEGFEAEKIVVEGTPKNVTIVLNYTETTKNLMVVYTIKYRNFDEGDAVSTTRDAIQKFCDDRGFKHFKKYSDDIINYNKNETVYTRFFILS